MRPERNLVWLARIAWVITAPFVRYDMRGGRCVTELSVGVIAVNHRSMFDVVAGLVCLHHFGQHPRLLIERKYVEGKWTAPFARAIGAIPVDRVNGGGTSVEAALFTLRNGTTIVMLPEGKLHHDPHDPRSVGPTRTGVSRLAVGAQVPVLAAALGGTADVMPPNARLPRLNPYRRKHVICNVADELIWLTGDDHRANTDRVMAAVQRLLVLPSET